MDNKYGTWTLGLLIAAVIITYMTVKDYQKASALEKDGVETAATISDIKESRGRRGRVTYTPVVSFQDANGNVCSLKTDGSNSSDYRIGQQVNIVYLPSDPSIGEMVGHSLMGRAKFFMVFGGILWVLTIGCGMFYLKTRAAQMASLPQEESSEEIEADRERPA